VLGALEASAGLLGAPITRRAKSRAWYRSLVKAPGTPPDRVFGLVWPALYATAAIAGARVWRSPGSLSRTRALVLWGTQLATNAAWTPLFFGARRPRLALVDLALLGTSVGGFALAARKIDRTAAWLSLPYLAWVGFAGYMNGFIVAKNRRRPLRPYFARRSIAT
jgi:tryptophan-rich sensory protein